MVKGSYRDLLSRKTSDLARLGRLLENLFEKYMKSSMWSMAVTRIRTIKIIGSCSARPLIGKFFKKGTTLTFINTCEIYGLPVASPRYFLHHLSWFWGEKTPLPPNNFSRTALIQSVCVQSVLYTVQPDSVLPSM
jgi:hypothetical protein